MKKYFVLLLVSLAAIGASAYDFEVDGIYYEVISSADKTVGVTDSGNDAVKYKGDIVVPETVKYAGEEYTVTTILSKAFAGCFDMQSIKLPSTLKEIADFAFYYDSFTSIELPEGLEKIGENAFGYVNFIKRIILPNTVTEIGKFCFNSCASLNEVVLPKSLKEISDHAFYLCPRLHVIEIPESVEKIGQYAFACCHSLLDVNLPQNLTEIGPYAFWDAAKHHFTIKPTIKSLGIMGLSEGSTLTIEDSEECLMMPDIPSFDPDEIEKLYLGRNVDLATEVCCMLVNNLMVGSNVIAIPKGILVKERIMLLGEVPPAYDCYPWIYDKIVLEIPAQYWETYKTAEPWCHFVNRVVLDPECIETRLAPATSTSDIYHMDGRRVTSPAAHGIHIQSGRKVMR